MSSKYTRDDIKNWMYLMECGCEEEDHSIHGAGMYKPSFNPEHLLMAVQQDHTPDNAMCPETYAKVAEQVCSDPHAALQAIRPIMQQIGVGCPQSFAKALFDMFTTAQDMGIIKPFNTEH